jgi:LacI family transcriptional regulator, galactose operon repressor
LTEHQRKGLIGVLVPLVYDLYFSAILSGVAEGAYEHGMELLLSPTQHVHAREVSLLERLKSVTDGALIILPEESSAELELALTDAYPFVVVDPLTALDKRIPSVAAEHEAGAQQAMEHLLGLGHRRIAAITGPPGWLATEARLRGYYAALAGAGIPPEPALQVTSDFEFAPGTAAAATLLGLPDPPTAVFAFNDAIALGTMRAAHDRGLRVPDDLSIVGFDDIKYAAMVTPALTTVRQPLADMGHTAVSVVLRLLEHERLDASHFEVATRLVVRDSTAPPRRSAAG